jgi:hypothetical protein
MKIGDIVESTDWREHGKQRRVTDIPGPGHIDHGYCYLQTDPGGFSTRVRLKKNGEPERYRLVEKNQTSIEE